MLQSEKKTSTSKARKRKTMAGGKNTTAAPHTGRTGTGAATTKSGRARKTDSGAGLERRAVGAEAKEKRPAVDERHPFGDPPRIAAEQRHRMIAERAYHIYLRRGPAPGGPSQDWLEAEAEIDAWLAGDRRSDR